ncbi:MAG: HNH endonuclease [Candidatus Promineifilaceae bacterium]
MSIYLPGELRRQLEEADDHRCAYCQTSQANSGQKLVPDHIIPESKGGERAFENLCFACRLCNEFKGPQTTAKDPLTNDWVSLFNPREQSWQEHFAWDASGLKIDGLTAVGRATIVALKINNEVIVPARQKWVSAGWHPPTIEGI